MRKVLYILRLANTGARDCGRRYQLSGGRRVILHQGDFLIFAYIWLYLFVFGYNWLYLVMFGYIWQYQLLGGRRVILHQADFVYCLVLSLTWTSLMYIASFCNKENYIIKRRKSALFPSKTFFVDFNNLGWLLSKLCSLQFRLQKWLVVEVVAWNWRN